MSVNERHVKRSPDGYSPKTQAAVSGRTIQLVLVGKPEDQAAALGAICKYKAFSSMGTILELPFETVEEYLELLETVAIEVSTHN